MLFVATPVSLTPIVQELSRNVEVDVGPSEPLLSMTVLTWNQEYAKPDTSRLPGLKLASEVVDSSFALQATKFKNVTVFVFSRGHILCHCIAQHEILKVQSSDMVEA